MNKSLRLMLTLLSSGVLVACSTADSPQKQSRELLSYTIGDPDDELHLMVSEGASARSGPHVVLKENQKVNLFGVDFVFRKGVLTATKNGEEERFTSPGSYYMYVTPETRKWKSGRRMPSFEGIVYSGSRQDDAARRKLEDSLPELIRAVKANSRERVNALLAKGANVNVRDENGYTPLHEAARAGLTDMARLLIAKGARVRDDGPGGLTPLHLAAEHGFTDTVRLLLENGADVNVKAPDGRTPLYVAAAHGHAETVRLLLRKGADVNVRERLGETPLSRAVRTRSVETVRLLLEKGADVKVVDLDGKSLLHWAAHADIARMLIDRDLDVNAGARAGSTPLHTAAKQDFYDVAELLLEKGADVKAKDMAGVTPLHEARSVAVARLLIKHGADVNARDERGSTPLHWAETAGLASLLIRQGAEVDARDVDGCTPLHVAARAGRPDVVRLLIARGADVKAKGDGGTPLDCAERNADDGELPESMRRAARDCALLLREAMKKQPYPPDTSAYVYRCFESNPQWLRKPRSAAACLGEAGVRSGL